MSPRDTAKSGLDETDEDTDPDTTSRTEDTVVDPPADSPDGTDTVGDRASPSSGDACSGEPDATEPDNADPSFRRRPRRRRLAVTAVGLLLIAVIGCAGFFGWKFKQLHDVSTASTEALAAAREYGITLTTVDSADIDDNTAAVLAGATGEFKELYSRSSAQLRQVLIDNDAAAQGTVIDAGVKSATPSKVEVLLFIDQSITNRINPTPRLDRNRVTLTMEHIDGRWLASKVDVL